MWPISLPASPRGAGLRGRAALDARLLDPAWLQEKLAATASPLALVGD
jgi:hypothetical protein